MRQTQKLSSIVTALMAISHDRVDYPAGAVFEAPEKDVVFLKMAKCVREPTSEELAAYRASLAPKPITTVNHFDTATDNELPQRTMATDEPDVTEPKPETVEPETVEAEQPEPETVEPESAPNPYDGWLKSDLNAELDKRGIERDVIRNDELEALLIADDKANA